MHTKHTCAKSPMHASILIKILGFISGSLSLGTNIFKTGCTYGDTRRGA